VFDLEDRLLEYAARVIRLADRLPKTPAGYHVANQLLRSGTAALPHHGEAQATESPNDFIHKMSIGLKELRETRRWLRLAKRVPLVQPASVIEPLLDETDELIRIFFSSIRTAKDTKLNVGRSRLRVER